MEKGTEIKMNYENKYKKEAFLLNSYSNFLGNQSSTELVLGMTFLLGISRQRFAKLFFHRYFAF